MQKQKFSLYRLVILGFLGALLVVVKEPLNWLPNIELVSLFLIVYVRVYGAQAFYPLYIFVAIEGLLYGFSDWFFNYLYVWAVLVAVACVFQKQRSPWVWALISAFFGLCFGGLCSLLYLVIANPAYMLAYWVQGLWFDIIHCIGNFVTALLLTEPLYRLLMRLSKWGE